MAFLKWYVKLATSRKRKVCTAFCVSVAQLSPGQWSGLYTYVAPLNQADLKASYCLVPIAGLEWLRQFGPPWQHCITGRRTVSS